MKWLLDCIEFYVVLVCDLLIGSVFGNWTWHMRVCEPWFAWRDKRGDY